MNEAYLCLGGNLGDKEENLKTAQNLVQQLAGEVKLESGIYETAAWGNTDQPDFLNKVIKIETKHSAAGLMNLLLEIEKRMGRMRDGEKWEARLIDIDILLFNNETIQDEHLSVPHPRLHLRKFVLMPLAEIAASLIHPVLKKTIGQLFAECEDILPAKKI
ncbi:MAG: 2-amino-4-hydroxy-6-hydroxymethyldihydropteridine diphosphokinase [Bacteroidia bacterium]